jgi:hypothetical protein
MSVPQKGQNATPDLSNSKRGPQPSSKEQKERK